jgi:hypothetical protein
MEMMTADGTEDLRNAEIGYRHQPARPRGSEGNSHEQVFDFRLTREVYKELREAGWDRVLKVGK